MLRNAQPEISEMNRPERKKIGNAKRSKEGKEAAKKRKEHALRIEPEKNAKSVNSASGVGL